MDAVEDLLPASAAYRQAGRILFAPEVRATGRPLTPLHGGHIGLLTTAGLLNGIFGEGPNLHVARWESIKVTDRFEETDENEVTTIRERGRFTRAGTEGDAGGQPQAEHAPQAGHTDTGNGTGGPGGSQAADDVIDAEFKPQ